MAGTERPFVAVIGGLQELDDAKATEAREVGRTLGVELAQAGFGLVVYFSDAKSLEPHVVKGYAAVVSDGDGEIRVRYSESHRGAVKFAEETTQKNLFQNRQFPDHDWEAPFYRSLVDEDGVDAVLLLGGRTTTFIAGQIALARCLPVLAIDEFGGAASKIWRQLAQRSPKTTHSWGTRPAADFIKQLKDECLAVDAQHKESLRRQQLLDKMLARRHQAGYAAAAFFGLLCVLYFGLVNIPSAASYPIIVFAGLMAAGATGALVRAILWEPAENDPRISLLLGSIAGFVVGLAYLIPQWIGAPGPLSPKPEGISATDKIQLASSILVAISAGVGFDSVFSRLRKQAQDDKFDPAKR
jgi:hypothetical protein